MPTTVPAPSAFWLTFTTTRCTVLPVIVDFDFVTDEVTTTTMYCGRLAPLGLPWPSPGRAVQVA